MKRAVFLDRDGTINSMVYNSEFGLVDSPANPDEFELLPGSGQAIRLIQQMGFLSLVVSNQPGIAKGKLTEKILEATTQRMHHLLALDDVELDAVYYCLHHPQAVLDEYRVECSCRKPKCGLLMNASEELNIDLSRSYFVGDGITDILAGQEAGVATILLCKPKPYLMDELINQGARPNYSAESLLEAARIIQQIEESDGDGATPFPGSMCLTSPKERNKAAI